MFPKKDQKTFEIPCGHAVGPRWRWAVDSRSVSDEADIGLELPARREEVGVTLDALHRDEGGTITPEIARVDTLHEPAWGRCAKQTLTDGVG